MRGQIKSGRFSNLPLLNRLYQLKLYRIRTGRRRAAFVYIIYQINHIEYICLPATGDSLVNVHHVIAVVIEGATIAGRRPFDSVAIFVNKVNKLLENVIDSSESNVNAFAESRTFSA